MSIKLVASLRCDPELCMLKGDPFPAVVAAAPSLVVVAVVDIVKVEKLVEGVVTGIVATGTVVVVASRVGEDVCTTTVVSDGFPKVPTGTG